MKDINTLSTIFKCSLGRFIGLSIITLGVYPLMWLYRTQGAVSNEFGRNYWDPRLPVILAAISGITQILSTFAGGGIYTVEINGFDYLGGIIYAGLWIYWSFRFKAGLFEYLLNEFKFSIKISNVALVLFGPAYVVYLINKLRKDYAVHQITKG